jgi:hypothetical protein
MYKKANQKILAMQNVPDQSKSGTPVIGSQTGVPLE